MTVHGAKGLEAPIVVLADTTTPPAGPPQRQPRLLALAQATPHAPTCFVWAGVKATDTAPVAAARERARREAEDEYRRLLYVAMTRAIDRLVICGADGERARPEGCWWKLVFAALKPPVSVEDGADDGDGKVWRYRKTPPFAGKTFAAAAPAPSTDERPSWLDRDASAEPPPVRLVSPALAYDETARRHLDRTAAEFSAEERETIVGQILLLLEDPRFAQLFLPGSRAEVAIVGRLHGGTLAVSGQVDRLAVTSDSVLIADYKTNRPAPRRLADVPPAYVSQLALYRAVLGELYPGKRIRAALVWTDVPDLMEISETSLDAALAAVTSA